MAEQGADRMIGTTIAGYRIVSRIGAGGMGEVFVAEHLRIDRRVAIKVLLPEMSNRTDMVARFFAEARATSSIRHPGIVEVLDCDVQPGGRAYIVMELLEGESLMARMARDSGFGQNQRSALGVTAEIASALAAAHGKSIVHRDLKPDNVFLAGDSRRPGGFVVKILDFGIAKLLGNDHQSGQAGMARTRTGALLGTPIYMSPEQCRGAAAVDWRADIYAMGCILFELLAGRPPFVYEGFGELIAAHIGEKPAPLQTLRPRVSPAVATFVARLLEKDPARRPQTMEAAGQEIASLLARLPAHGAESEPAAKNATTSWARGPAGEPSSPRWARDGARVLAGAGGTGPGGTLLAEPGNLGGTSQTTLSELATEEVRVQRSRRVGRAKIWGPILVIGLGGGVAGVVVYQHQTTHERPGDSKARLIAVSAPAGGSGRVQVADASAQAAATVDGAAAPEPTRAQASATEPSTLPAPTESAKPAKSAHPAESPGAPTAPAVRHRRHAEPAPLDLNDEERKL